MDLCVNMIEKLVLIQYGQLSIVVKGKQFLELKGILLERNFVKIKDNDKKQFDL